MSTTFQTNNRTSYGRFSIVVTENSTDISTNTSDVTVDLKYTSAEQYYCGVNSFTITDATGTQLASWSRSYGVVNHISQGTQTLKTFSNLKANHLQDGSGALTIYIKYRIGNTTTYEETFTFNSTTIPRASTLYSATTSLTITSSSTAGVSITVLPQTTGFYHIVTYSTTGAGGSGTLVNKEAINSATPYTLTKAKILTAIPNRTIDTLVFTCSTYSDSACTVQVGSSVSLSMTINLDVSLAPTLNISAIGVSTTSGEYSISGYLIADGKTKATVEYTPTLQTGATLSSIVLTPPVGTFANITSGASGTSATVKSDALPLGLTSNVAYTIKYRITDSRGLSTTGTANYNKTCYAYAKPLIEIRAYRVATNTGDDAAKEDPSGAYLYYKLIATCTAVGSNAIKESTSNTYIKVGSGTAYEVDTEHWQPLALDASATINARAEDSISYSTASVIVGAASFPLDLYDDSAGNVGGGFGTIATPGQYEFAYPAMGPGTIEVIRGTQGASTASWTGTSKQKALREGMMILYYLPYASASSTNVTLNLTLADGSTTGALNCYYNSTTRLTTHFGAYAQILLIYHYNWNINGTNYTGWWHDGDYDSTNIQNLRLNYTIYKAYTVLYRYQILFTKDVSNLLPANTVSNSTATTKTLTTESFNPFGQVYYYNSTTEVSAGAVIGNNSMYSQTGVLDLRYGFNTGTTLTANKEVYLVCVPQSDGTVKLHTTPITQTLPTAFNGLIYKFLGLAYDTYRIELLQDKPCYYHNGAKMVLWAGKYDWVTVWTGTLQGGSNQSVDVSAFSRIKIYFVSYSSAGQFEIDLTTQTPTPQVSGQPYAGSGVCPYYASSNSRIETHVCKASVSTAKTTVYNDWQGYYYGTTYTARNSNASYYIYRIDGIIE